MLSRVLSRVCQGALDHVCHWVQGAVRVLRIMFAIGRCQGAVQGGVQGCC